MSAEQSNASGTTAYSLIGGAKAINKQSPAGDLNGATVN
jgi:hypothetical protein